MKRLVVLGGVIAALSVSSSVLAADASVAQLGAVSGQVLVNKGDGFKAATPGTALRAGDRVIVRGKGKAGLKYADGCSVSLASGSMATINGATPCKSGAKAAGLIGAQGDQGEDGRQGSPGWGGKEIAVVAAVGLGAAALTIQHDDDKEQPVSP